MEGEFNEQKIQNIKYIFLYYWNYISLKRDFNNLWSTYLCEDPIRLSSYTFDGQERDKVVDYSQWE